MARYSDNLFSTKQEFQICDYINLLGTTVMWDDVVDQFSYKILQMQSSVHDNIKASSRSAELILNVNNSNSSNIDTCVASSATGVQLPVAYTTNIPTRKTFLQRQWNLPMPFSLRLLLRMFDWKSHLTIKLECIPVNQS